MAQLAEYLKKKKYRLIGLLDSSLFVCRDVEESLFQAYSGKLVG